jgi:hypothetical protein
MHFSSWVGVDAPDGPPFGEPINKYSHREKGADNRDSFEFVKCGRNVHGLTFIAHINVLSSNEL